MSKLSSTNCSERTIATSSSTAKAIRNNRSPFLATGNIAIPSRLDNPFATCWTKPGAIKFQFDAGQSADRLVANLASQNWEGAIIGPHGCGKSTLLETLKPALIAAHCQLHAITLRGGQRRLPDEFLTDCQKLIAKRNLDAETRSVTDPTPHAGRVLIVVDGFEQLSWLQRARFKWFCRRRNIGMLVTAHRPIGIRPLIFLSPGQKLIEQLVADLCRKVSTEITALDVAASCARHGSNVRDVFFDLYDRHERLRNCSGLGVSAGL